jgi:peptide/nickel transport system substrate-binding protein
VFKTSVPYFAGYVSNQPIGAVLGATLPKAYFEKVGLAGFNRAPIGAGLWKLIHNVANQSLTFERFDGYYDKAERPKFKELKLDVVPDISARVEALIGGTADIILWGAKSLRCL